MLEYWGKAAGAATVISPMHPAKFRTASQVIESFRTHGKVKVERVGRGLYGIFAKGNPEWSCMARYSRTELLYWANRF